MSSRVPVRRHLRRKPAPIYAVHKITGVVPESRLLPRRRRSVPGMVFGVDELLGDDQYVFLSVESVFQPKVGDAYVYSARDLIRRGAKWREKDILMTTEATNLLNAFRMWKNEFTPHRQEPDEAGDLDPNAEDSPYYWPEWWDDIDRYMWSEAIDNSEGVRMAFEALKRKSLAMTHSGSEAVRLLEERLSGPFQMEDNGEILFPRSLPLGGALGVVLND